ncbi:MULTISPECIES: NifU family protein [unclassified Campylobacter]|uniref:NifU family protein n=1 Tax=unclassified Campylobacter TaxID=2593542 RepID=UPI00123837B0|nr:MULTISPECIES: NifU family protein [unclassified Campylobacter]KAA6227305.1 NifU family protein [Campylobacter sp. LR286c]KAA6227821.1 NifU family protein [Campylobacter sp. LR185c]KAA6228229.1 NifU family protein [Campylobacter sp. LR196d]KAA6229229.1 NifU family protein [Campylobacter sp. LR291e]KAA6231034.1 NifU family protein [Campylobacter sp. LR264d]
MLPFNDEELINPVKSSLAKNLHILEQDGGGLEFLGVKNGVVYVHLTGACSGCVASSVTLKYGLERQLKIDIHPDISLINLNGGKDEFAKL